MSELNNISDAQNIDELMDKHSQSFEYWEKKLSSSSQSNLFYKKVNQDLSALHLKVKYSQVMDQAISNLLMQFSVENKIELDLILQSCFSLLLNRHQNEIGEQQNSSVFAMPAKAKGVEYIQLFNSDINVDHHVFDLFDSQLNQIKEASFHDLLPFTSILKAVTKRFKLVTTDPFSIMLSINNKTLNQYDALEKLYPYTDLHLNIDYTNNEIKLNWLYASECFNSETISSIVNRFESLLFSLITEPTTKLVEHCILTDAEKSDLIQWNQTEYKREHSLCVHELFEKNVLTQPHSIAVEFETESISYEQLNIRSNQLAHLLIDHGASLEDIIGIYATRSIEMVVAILAIQKAGCAYLPLDPDLPIERIQYMAENSKLNSIVTLCELGTQLLSLENIDRYCLDDPAILKKYSKNNISTQAIGLSQQNLAYVIYTSGSTGQPKGVESTHLGLMNRISWMQSQYPITDQDSILQKTPFNFDVSVWEFLWPLMIGAKLVMAIPNGHKDPNYLENIIHSKNISVLHFVPSMLTSTLSLINWQDIASLKYVFCSGEALSKSTADAFMDANPFTRLINLYGPTEASIDVSYWEYTRAIEHKVIPIGRPIDNTKLFILDKHLMPVPNGVSGELYIAGDGLARGYLNNSELTSDAFVHVSLNKAQQNIGLPARLYKTGDITKWIANPQTNQLENIEYIGRMDQQIKLRGFRIELGEIESLIINHDAIKQAAVMLSKSKQNLICYAVAVANQLNNQSQGELTQLINEYIKRTLPEYMVPYTYVFLDSLPLSPNGKVSRKDLIEPVIEQDMNNDYVAPSSEFEQQLCQIWQVLLNVEKISVNDDFYKLGGNSILLIGLISQLRTLGFDFVVQDILQNPTIKQLDCLSKHRVHKPVNNEQLNLNDTVFSLPNRQMLFKGPFKHHWNMSGILKVIEPNFEYLKQALQQILNEHVGLTHQFFVDENDRVTEKKGAIDHSNLLSRVDLSYFDDETKRIQQVEQLSDSYHFKLNLSKKLFKFVLFDFGESTPSRLLIIIHHALMDGYSVPLFVSELTFRYLSLVAGMKYDAPAKTSSVNEWGYALHQYANNPLNVKAESDYWLSRSWHNINTLMDDTDGYKKNTSGDKTLYGTELNYEIKLAKPLSEYLLNHLTEVELGEDVIIFSGFSQIISELTQSNTAYFELVVSGRGNIVPGTDASRTIGHFAENMPVLLDINQNDNIVDQVLSMAKQLHNIPHAGVGFNAVKYLNDNPIIRDQFQNLASAEFKINYIPSALMSNPQPTNMHLPYHLMTPTQESTGRALDPELSELPNPIYIAITIENGQFVFNLKYRNNMYNAQTIELLMKGWINKIELIISHLTKGSEHV
ncbi:amino acid adenylation domain-containing protein [Marinicellulosiphila megalodicopiae]|uniref:amino acid adenylation domain-containing protein n=1 Tax=Marinicellulosiphila megalodicopiae TaxID=2724896 RepID=UPI003BB1DB96